jgi:DNA (cytosine-5)-methyltransferase 1
LKLLDLFSGIGGFSLGLERAGFETVAFCEIEDYPVKVLKKHWPDLPVYNDVRTLTAEQLKNDGITVDAICGGFPCQDISTAGAQAGIEKGERSGLWSECARLLGEIRPRVAIFENVTALISGDEGRWFQRVLWDISEVGYDAEWHCIPASELGAHHHRDRIWIIAYPNDSECKRECAGPQKCNSALGNTHLANTDNYGPATPQKRKGTNQGVNDNEKGTIPASESKGRGKSRVNEDMPHANSEQRERWAENGDFKSFREGVRQQLKRCLDDYSWPEWQLEPALARMANGVPNKSHRIKALGNAVVPQIPEVIGRAIMEAINEH